MFVFIDLERLLYGCRLWREARDGWRNGDAEQTTEKSTAFHDECRFRLNHQQISDHDHDESGAMPSRMGVTHNQRFNRSRSRESGAQILDSYTLARRLDRYPRFCR